MTPTPFAVKLAALMAARGIGVRALAAEVPCDPGLISRYRTGAKRPSAKMAARLDDVLDAGGELATVRPVDDDEERVFAAIQQPHRVDEATVRHLATTLAAQRRLEDTIGSGPLVASVAAQLDTITGLVRDVRGPVRPKLVAVAAQFAQFAGWLHTNTGKRAKGQTLMRRAIEWAVESGDPDLISETTSCLGNIAWMGGQVGATIGLSQAAIRHAGYPGQVAISSAQQARAHAVTAELGEAERLLDQADEFAERERSRLDEAPPWLYYHVPGFYDLHRGYVYRLAGRTDPAYNGKAAVALLAGRDRLPEEMRRSEWAGDFVYQLGRAYGQAGQPERVAELERELSELSDELGSELLATRAGGLRRLLV